LKEWRRLLLACGDTRECRQGASGQDNDIVDSHNEFYSFN
jgi:hypothetical protein